MKMRRVRRYLLILIVASVLLGAVPVLAGACPPGWQPVGGWYQEGDTWKLRCSAPGQDDWWMDSGGEPRPGCSEKVTVPSPAPVLSRRVGYQRQRYGGSCIFAAFASIIGVSEQSLIDGFKASGFGHSVTPELHGAEIELFVKWLNTQGFHFENILWYQHGVVPHRDWRAMAQNAGVRGVVLSRGHAWVLLSVDEQGMTVWDPLNGTVVRLPCVGIAYLFLPIQGEFEDYGDYVSPPPSNNRVVTSY